MGNTDIRNEILSIRKKMDELSKNEGESLTVRERGHLILAVDELEQLYVSVSGRMD